MTRRVWVQINGELVDKATLMPAPVSADSGALWGDEHYRGQCAPDGTPIDTRTKHRQYMRDRGLTTVDDYTNEFSHAEKQRAEFYRGAPDRNRREDIARAFEKLHG